MRFCLNEYRIFWGKQCFYSEEYLNAWLLSEEFCFLLVEKEREDCSPSLSTWFLLLWITILLWGQRIKTYKFFSEGAWIFHKKSINFQKNWTKEWYWNKKAIEINNSMHLANSDNCSLPFFSLFLFLFFIYLRVCVISCWNKMNKAKFKSKKESPKLLKEHGISE